MVKGEYGATVDETRSGEPVWPNVRDSTLFDVDLIFELPYGPAAHLATASEAGQMAAPRLRASDFRRFLLRFRGRPQMGQEQRPPDFGQSPVARSLYCAALWPVAKRASSGV